MWEKNLLKNFAAVEAQLNMDVNLCRLPDEMKSISKFPVPLADIRWHLSSTDSTNILSKQPKRQFIIKKNRPLRTVTFHHMKINALRLLQNFLINFSPTSQSPNSASESHLHQEPQTGLTLHCPGSHDAYQFR